MPETSQDMASNSDTGSVFTQVSPAVLIERRGSTFAFIRWTLSNFAALGRLAKQQTPWVQVGKHDCRLLLYPGGRPLISHAVLWRSAVDRDSLVQGLPVSRMSHDLVSDTCLACCR